MTIQSLWRYPLKSGAPESLSTVTVNSLGFEGDRQYVLADSNGQFISARSHPLMGQIQLDGDHWRFKGCASPVMGFQSDSQVTVWRREHRAHLADNAVNQWFSDCLNDTLVLLRLEPDDSQHFGDSNPLMVLNQVTVDAIGDELGRDFPALQLRPNVLLTGGTAFGEESLGTLQWGDVLLEPVEPCTRCKMINLTPGADDYPADWDVSPALRRLNDDFVAGMHYRVVNGGQLSI